jgi:hypothetical protein
VWAASRPDIADELNRLVQRLLLSSGTPETLLRQLRPYLLRPGVLYLILAIISGITPLIEEALKPVGLWLLARRRLTPAEGFVGGLLSGAGFAMFESLGNAAVFTGESWAAVTLGRAGTDLIHITASGLVGWALASAWRERRYLRLGATYLIAVFLHGLWNMISLSMGISPLVRMAPENLPPILRSTAVAPVALAVLIVILLVMLVGANARLRRAQPDPGSPVSPLQPGDEPRPAGESL